MIVTPGQVVTKQFPTRNKDGEKMNATGTPTAVLYVNADTGSATVTNLATGLYVVEFTVPSDAEDYDTVTVIVDATIDGTASSGEVFNATVFTIPPFSVLGTVDSESSESPNIECKVGETSKPKSVTCVDTAGDPIDLTDWGDKVLVIERPNHRSIDVQVIDNAGITISGDSDNVFTFQPNAAVLAQPGEFIWSLREASTQDVIIDGRISVAYSPMEDA